MAWKTGETALSTDNAAQLSVTSTSTMCLVSSTGYARLRMFGLSVDTVVGGMVPTSVSEVLGPTPTIFPAGETTTTNIAYIESESVVAASAATDAYAFELIRASSSGAAPLHQTVVPVSKGDMVLEGDLAAPFYKDVHLLELAGDRGYLMVAVRVWAAGMDLVHGRDTGPGVAKSVVVGFWAPSTDPTLTSPDVRGPIFLVGRAEEIDGVDSALWLGVPCATEADEGGEPMVYIYYTAERTDFDVGGLAALPLDFTAGTRMRAIHRADLLLAFGFEPEAPVEADSRIEFDTTGLLASLEDIATAVAVASVTGYRAAGMIAGARRALARSELARSLHPASALATMHLGGPIAVGPVLTTAWSQSLATNEELWSSEAAIWLVPGEERGKVRVWVATGTAFQEGDAPLLTNPRGNTLLWDRYETIKDVDAQAVWAGGQLLLFISANRASAASALPAGSPYSGDYAYGICRLAAIPASVAGEFGIDFVMHEYLPSSGATSDRDMVALSPADVSTGNAEHMRLDPDPVQLPNGDWIVLNGVTGKDPVSDKGMPMERNTASDAEVSRLWSDAWT